jgi:hypothetical protein
MNCYRLASRTVYYCDYLQTIFLAPDTSSAVSRATNSLIQGRPNSPKQCLAFRIHRKHWRNCN